MTSIKDIISSSYDQKKQSAGNYQRSQRNKFMVSLLLSLLTLMVLVGVAYAAFGDKGEILGSRFSVGSADLKLYRDLTLGTDPSNLVEELTGPSFASIGSNWQNDYLIKILNNGTGQVRITSASNYLTANDPDDLRSIIYVEPIVWNDTNTNGQVDSGEEGTSYGRKTVIKWKTEGYDLGLLDSGSTKSLILRFSTDSVSDAKQGKTGIFDFEFNSVEETQVN